MVETELTDPDRSNHEMQQQSRLKLLEEARKELLSNVVDEADQRSAPNSSDACDEPPMKKNKGEHAIFTFLLSAMCENEESGRPLTSDQAVVAHNSKELKIYCAKRVNSNVDSIKFWLN